MIQTAWAAVAWRIPAMPARLFSVRRNSTPRGGKDSRQRWIALLQLRCSSFCLLFAQLSRPPSPVSVRWMFSAVTRISQLTFDISENFLLCISILSMQSMQCKFTHIVFFKLAWHINLTSGRYDVFWNAWNRLCIALKGNNTNTRPLEIPVGMVHGCIFKTNVLSIALSWSACNIKLRRSMEYRFSFLV